LRGKRRKRFFNKEIFKKRGATLILGKNFLRAAQSRVKRGIIFHGNRNRFFKAQQVEKISITSTSTKNLDFIKKSLL